MEYRISVKGKLNQVLNFGQKGELSKDNDGYRLVKYFDSEANAKKYLGDKALGFYEINNINEVLSNIAKNGILTIDGITAKIEEI